MTFAKGEGWNPVCARGGTGSPFSSNSLEDEHPLHGAGHIDIDSAELSYRHHENGLASLTLGSLDKFLDCPSAGSARTESVLALDAG
ncbi:MAG: hypothetical protein CME36_20585 [unclassified Hahellaceae]|nr:hypothetical protein [Hahellaceae bacterium]